MYVVKYYVLQMGYIFRYVTVIPFYNIEMHVI